MEVVELYKDILEIRIDYDAKLVCSTWLHYSESNNFRQGLSHIASCINKHHLTLWLQDCRNLSAPGVLDQKWILEELMPLLEKSDLQKIAMVMPGDYILHMVAAEMRDKIYGKFGRRILLECFSRSTHGLYWLQSTDETSEFFMAV